MEGSSTNKRRILIQLRFEVVEFSSSISFFPVVQEQALCVICASVVVVVVVVPGGLRINQASSGRIRLESLARVHTQTHMLTLTPAENIKDRARHVWSSSGKTGGHTFACAK